LEGLAEWEPQPLQTLRTALADVVDTQAGPDAILNTHFRHVLLVDRSRSELALDVLRDVYRYGATAAVPPSPGPASPGAATPGQLGVAMPATSQSNFEVVSLSHFPDDRTPTKQTECLALIRDAVEAGHTVVLRNTRPLHSALYSLLNRHYTASPNAERGAHEAYVTMSIGSLSRSVKVHPSARIIVHLSEDELASTPLPFLSRFERYVVGVDELLGELLHVRFYFQYDCFV
jgi:hypothetical protein